MPRTIVQPERRPAAGAHAPSCPQCGWTHLEGDLIPHFTWTHPGSGAELHSSDGFSISRDYGSEGKHLWGSFSTNTGMYLKIELANGSS